VGLIPNPPHNIIQIGIYYSSAFSQYSCYQVPPLPPTTFFCGVNNYTYNLVQCNPDSSFANCVDTASIVGIHYFNGGPAPFPDGPSGTCESQIITGLNFCGKARYSCCITDGPSPPREDAFIEWYWAIQYTDVSSITHYITGKFTFCASASHIFNTWTNNGNSYFNPPPGIGYGIPMFNPSNHNV
jgi:hypothetical protein